MLVFIWVFILLLVYWNCGGRHVCRVLTPQVAIDQNFSIVFATAMCSFSQACLPIGTETALNQKATVFAFQILPS